MAQPLAFGYQANVKERKGGSYGHSLASKPPLRLNSRKPLNMTYRPSPWMLPKHFLSLLALAEIWLHRVMVSLKVTPLWSSGLVSPRPSFQAAAILLLSVSLNAQLRCLLFPKLLGRPTSGKVLIDSLSKVEAYRTYSQGRWKVGKNQGDWWEERRKRQTF